MNPGQQSTTTNVVYHDAQKMKDIKDMLAADIKNMYNHLRLTIQQQEIQMMATLDQQLDKYIQIPSLNYMSQAPGSRFTPAGSQTLGHSPFTNRIYGGTQMLQAKVGELKQRFDFFDHYRQKLANRQSEILNTSNSLDKSDKEGIAAQLDRIKESIQDARNLTAHPDLEFAPMMKQEIVDLMNAFQQIYSKIYELSQEESYKNVGVYDQPEESMEQFRNYEAYSNRHEEMSMASQTRFDIEQSQISGAGKESRFLFQEFLKKKNIDEDDY